MRILYMKMDLSKLKKMKMPSAQKEEAAPAEESQEDSELEAMDMGELAPELEESLESPEEEASETVGHDLAEVSDEDLMAEIKARGLSAKMSAPSPMAPPAKKPAPESEMY
jgi:hypothetical protein